MNKLAGTTLVAVAGLALGLLVWETGKVAASREKDHIQFRRSTSWSYDDVRKCLKDGNGSQIFQEYAQAFISVPKGPPEPLDASTYIDRRGSSLVVERVGGRTEVRLKSAHPLSDAEKDLLEWCVSSPQITWIPPQFRSK